MAIGGTRFVARWPNVFHAPRFSESPLLPAVILCLGLAAFAGADRAGGDHRRVPRRHGRRRDQGSPDFEDEVAPLYAFFPPFFFVYVGLQVELDAFTDLGTLALLIGVTALAFATKFGAAWLAARSMGPRDAVVVGLGMVPRGEVGIIVAGIGATSAVVEPDLFAVIVGMSIATTLVIPPLLRRALARPPADDPPARPSP